MQSFKLSPPLPPFFSTLSPFTFVGKQNAVRHNGIKKEKKNSHFLNLFYNAPINVKPAGGRGGGGKKGIGRGYDIFAKKNLQFPTPGLIFCLKSPPRVTQFHQRPRDKKSNYPTWGQQYLSKALPPGQG